MDTLARYRQIVRTVLKPLTERTYSGLDVVNEAVYDTEHDRYLVISMGWQRGVRRIYHNLAHLEIIDGKIWIQRDGTEEGIAYALEEAGVSKSDIVLGFHPEDVRPDTGYAVA